MNNSQNDHLWSSKPLPTTTKEGPTTQDIPTDGAPTDEPCSNSDEGYGFIVVSPSSNLELGETPVDASGTATDMVAPLTGQADATTGSKTYTPSLTALRSPEKPRALLVDDNIVNLRIMQMYWKKLGLPYCSASDSRQTVKVFSEQQAFAAAGKGTAIELVLMDLQMPVCDGVESTREIRLQETRNGWKACVLFIVTGQDSQMGREAASAANADDSLVKPVAMKLLDSALKRYFPAFEVGRDTKATSLMRLKNIHEASFLGCGSCMWQF
ncbi:Fc.00g053900.m01.CDS01 [Cosmosporella sp. VM-42]